MVVLRSEPEYECDMSVEVMPARARFEQIEVGRVFQTSASFGYAEMDQFAALSGDDSAIHTDPETAKRFGFPDRVQYGFLLAALLSRIVGTNLEHAICAAVQLDFVKPAIAGDRIDVRAEVTQVQEAIRSVVLKITMLNGRDIITRGKLTTIFLPEA
jgi:3-hydroxybutyryl-CoA dehydratase